MTCLSSLHRSRRGALRAGLLAAAIGLATTTAGAAAITLDGSGRLVGATGVTVAGVSYDVSFTDGTCIALFGGCDTVSDFAFSTNAQARAASLALMDQVFNAFATVDADPTLTRGCEDGAYVYLGQRYAHCYAVTPYGFSMEGNVATHVALNDLRDFMDQAGGADTALIYGRDQTLAGTTTFSRYYTYAVWSPASLLLAALGLALLRATTAGSRPAR